MTQEARPTIQKGHTHHRYTEEDNRQLAAYDGTWPSITAIAARIGVNPLAARQAANKLGYGNKRDWPLVPSVGVL